MAMTASQQDYAFRDRFEAGAVPPEKFGHREHLRLAYVYLCDSSVAEASTRMRRALQAFLRANNVPAEKYHETLTGSWVQAVRHFMARGRNAASFEAFLKADDRLLDTRIMLSHYTQDRLFSDAARQRFVPPDRQPIPQYDGSGPG